MHEMENMCVWVNDSQRGRHVSLFLVTLQPAFTPSLSRTLRNTCSQILLSYSLRIGCSILALGQKQCPHLSHLTHTLRVLCASPKKRPSFTVDARSQAVRGKCVSS